VCTRAPCRTRKSAASAWSDCQEEEEEEEEQEEEERIRIQ